MKRASDSKDDREKKKHHTVPTHSYKQLKDGSHMHEVYGLTMTQVQIDLKESEKKTLNLLQNRLPVTHSSELMNAAHDHFCKEFDDIWEHKILKHNTVSIIGAPLNGGQKITGCDLTNGIYRKEGYYKELEHLGWKIKDCGDIDFKALWEKVENKKDDPTHVKAKDCHEVGFCSEVIADRVCKEAQKGNFVLTVGGDHSVAFGSLAGTLRARPNTRVIWVDAHADCNTPAISPSGNMHGMPMGGHLGAMKFDDLPGWQWFKPTLHQGNCVFIALRDLDKWEKAILKAIGAHVFTRYHIDKIGIGAVMKEAMHIINPFGNQPLHLSFDIDGIDPKWAPSTGTVSPGGLTYREARFICEYLAETECLCSMDLVEINPTILQGALAGHADEVITTSCEKVKTMDPHVLQQLKRNPTKTLHMGWDLVMSACGERII